jgi:hypothetical protein
VRRILWSCYHEVGGKSVFNRFPMHRGFVEAGTVLDNFPPYSGFGRRLKL